MQPAVQYDPAGQIIPVTLSAGVGEVAPPMHTNPALHGPVGDTSPTDAQYNPGGQGEH